MESIYHEECAMKAFRLLVDRSPRNDLDSFSGVQGAADVPEDIPSSAADVNLELVKKEEFMKPDGRFRSTLRISVNWYLRLEDRSITTVATGWLVEKDLMVTAAHCVRYKERGNALSLTAFMGYAGPASATRPEAPLVVAGLQRRSGEVVVLPAEWSVRYQPEHDVAFVRLDRPFDIPDAQLLRYEQTPEWKEWSPEEYKARKSGLLVVGYPGAVPSADYGMFLHRMCSSRGDFWEWDPECKRKDECPGTLGFSKAFMCPGMSGSPVLWFKNGHERKDEFVVIGTVAYKDDEFDITSRVGTDRNNSKNEFPMYIGLLNDIRDGRVDISSGQRQGQYSGARMTWPLCGRRTAALPCSRIAPGGGID